VVVEWGHDDEVVEYYATLAWVPYAFSRFNGATTMKSWNTKPNRNSGISIGSLQWGHDHEVVESYP